MPKMKIESDGTVEGTKVMLDGTEVTEEENVVSTYFSASVRYGKYVTFDYSTKEKKDDGSYVVKSYGYHSPDDDSEPRMMKSAGPEGLGKAVAEDQESLNGDRVLGSKFHMTQVVDRSRINPNHRFIIADLYKDTDYKIK